MGSRPLVWNPLLSHVIVLPCFWTPRSFFVLRHCTVFVLRLTLNWAKLNGADNCLFSSNKPIQTNLPRLVCPAEEGKRCWLYEHTPICLDSYERSGSWWVLPGTPGMTVFVFFFLLPPPRLMNLATCHSIQICRNTALKGRLLLWINEEEKETSCEELCVVKARFGIREDTAVRADRQKWEKMCAVLYVCLTPIFWIISKEAHSASRAVNH